MPVYSPEIILTMYNRSYISHQYWKCNRWFLVKTEENTPCHDEQLF